MSTLIQESINSSLEEPRDEKLDFHGRFRHRENVKIAVMDLGPDFLLPSGRRLGAKLQLKSEHFDKIRYFAPTRVYAPRAEGKTREEVVSLAKSNHVTIDELLDSVMEENCPTIFVNDVTLYFQWGKVDKMIQLAKRPQTFIANGYKGKSLRDDKESGIASNEAAELERFSSEMNSVIMLD